MKIRKPFFIIIIATILGMVIACDEPEISASSGTTSTTDGNGTYYTVSFVANGGSPAPLRQYISYGDKVTEPAYMTKTDYIFGGWYKETDCINQWVFDFDTVTANITLYAGWYTNYRDIKYTVNFEANGGSPAPLRQTIFYGGRVTEPASMTKTGYGFDGWYKEAACINQWNFDGYGDYITDNITLYAKWVIPKVVTDEIEGGTLAEKFQWINSNAESHNTYILEVSSDEYLNPQNLSYSGKSNVSIQLTGTGGVKTIEIYGSGSLFTIGNNVTLVLNENIVLKGSVAVAGNLIMNNGSKITGGVSVNSGRQYEYQYEYGNYVYVWYSGTFTMNGGEISGGEVSVSDEDYNSTTGTYYGGTFTMNGGKIGGGRGVYVGIGTTFTMTGGEISDNYGSGVYVRGYDYNTRTTFTMNGGEISGNTGSGVYISNGTFIMTGGKISDNTSYDGGGGVYISNGTFTMTGGEISGNTVNSDYYGGGGVYVASNSRFEKTGGIITGYSSDTVNGNVVKNYSNILDNRGHAVYVAHNDSRFVRRKETTAGQGDNLIYIRNEPAPPTISGAWDEE